MQKTTDDFVLPQTPTDAFGLPQTAFDDECTNGAKNYCFKCQATLYPGQRFCGACGYEVSKRDAVYVKAGVMRRTIAEIIDRLVPLPFNEHRKEPLGISPCS